MFSTQFVRFMVIFGLVGNYFGKMSAFSFELQLGNFEWNLEAVVDESISDLGSQSSLAYPSNVGHWYGSEDGFVSCIKFIGAIRILVPVLLPNGTSQTFILDVPPNAVAEGRCSMDLFYPNSQFISFTWKSPILDTNEMVPNKFFIEFQSFINELGSVIYGVSKLSVSYYKAQFVRGIRTLKIEQTVDNLSLFPVSSFNSLKCANGQLTTETDLFHVCFFDAQWEAFNNFINNDDFQQPFTSSDCVPVPKGQDDDDDAEPIAFWKAWIVFTIIVFIVCSAIFVLLYFAVTKCLNCYRASHDEGYETFA